MGKRLLGLAILCAIALGLFGSYELAVRSGRGGESSPLYSTRRHDPYGTAALADLLTERGVEVRYLERPHLDEAAHGVLIEVLPLPPKRPGLRSSAKAPFTPDVRPLIAWISKGNTVVQFSLGETELMAAFLGPSSEKGQAAGAGPAARQEPDAAEIEEHEAAGDPPDQLPGRVMPAEWTPAAREILGLKGALPAPMYLRSPLMFELGQRPAARPIALCGKEAVAVESRFGEGRAIFVGAPTPALNDGLDFGGNLDFILAIVGKGPVILDEWSHGIGREDSIMGVIRRFGLLPFLFQAIFVLGLYIWSARASRPPERAESGRWPPSIEQIKTLGHLYSRTFSREETALRVRQEVLRRLGAALRCSAAEVERQRARLGPREADRVAEMITLTADEPAARRAKAAERALAESLTRSHQFLEEKTHGRSIA